MADLVYPPVVTLAKGLFRYLGVRFDVRGAENVPRTGGAVLCLNHVGYLDFTFAGYAAQPRHVRFMAKESVFHHPVSGPLMRGMGHIPVDRAAGAASFAAALDALRAGEVVGVFPEATISRSFELKEFKNGAVRLAQQAGVPLLPAVIWGSQRIWTKDRPRRLRRDRVPVLIAVGEPVPVAPDADVVAAVVDVKRRMQQLLDGVQRDYPGAPAGDPWWLPVRLGGTAPTLEEASALDRAEAVERSRARRAGPAGPDAPGRPSGR